MTSAMTGWQLWRMRSRCSTNGVHGSRPPSTTSASRSAASPSLYSDAILSRPQLGQDSSPSPSRPPRVLLPEERSTGPVGTARPHQLTTIAPIPNNGTCNRPPPPVFPCKNPIPQPALFNPYLHHHPPNSPDPPPNFNFSHQYHHSPTFPHPIQPTALLPHQSRPPPQHDSTNSLVPLNHAQHPVPIPNPTHLVRLPKHDFPKFDGEHAQF